MSDDNSMPLVTITAQQMFEMITRMETVTNNLVSGINVLKEVADDHEDRLRIVEARSDVDKRLDAFEARLNQHHESVVKQGERLGRVEAWIDTRQNPWVVSGVVTSIASIIIGIILFLV